MDGKSKMWYITHTAYPYLKLNYFLLVKIASGPKDIHPPQDLRQQEG